MNVAPIQRLAAAVAVVVVATAALFSIGCSTGGGAPARPQPFHCDGCTTFPDGVPGDPRAFRAACNRHDLAYWRGGTWRERLAADQALRNEIRDQGRPVIAAAMFAGVRLGGAPCLPTPWRWGFAWPWGRGYRPLTPEEIAALEHALETHPPPDDCLDPEKGSEKGSVITY